MKHVTVAELYEDLAAVQHRLGHADWRLSLLGAISELGEALQELPWRPWRAKDQREPNADELGKALGELVDAFCTIPRVCIALGISAEAFSDACQRHVERKWERIDNGTDTITSQLRPD